MSAERVAFLNKLFITAARSEKYKEFFAKIGEDAIAPSAAETRKVVDSDYAEIGDIVKSLGLAKK